MATQGVRYQIEEVLKGKLPEGTHELEVQHVVIEGSRTADPSANSSKLSEAVFGPGTRLIVLVKKQGQSPVWLGVDEEYGVISADASVAAIRHLVKQLSVSH